MPSHPATCFLGQLPLSTRVQARYKRGRGPLTKKRYSRGITETSHIGDANHTVTSEHRMMNPRGSSTQHAATLLAKQTKGQRTSVTGRQNNLAGRKCYWFTGRSTWSPWQLLQPRRVGCWAHRQAPKPTVLCGLPRDATAARHPITGPGQPAVLGVPALRPPSTKGGKVWV